MSETDAAEWIECGESVTTGKIEREWESLKNLRLRLPIFAVSDSYATALIRREALCGDKAVDKQHG